MQGLDTALDILPYFIEGNKEIYWCILNFEG